MYGLYTQSSQQIATVPLTSLPTLAIVTHLKTFCLRLYSRVLPHVAVAEEIREGLSLILRNGEFKQ